MENPIGYIVGTSEIKHYILRKVFKKRLAFVVQGVFLMFSVRKTFLILLVKCLNLY